MERTRKEMMEYTRGLKDMMEVVLAAHEKGHVFVMEVAEVLVAWREETLIPWREVVCDDVADGDELAISAFDIPLPRF